MPPPLTKFSAIELKQHREDSAVSASNDRASGATATSELTTEQPIRCSQHTHCPSAHKPESVRSQLARVQLTIQPFQTKAETEIEGRTRRQMGLIRQPANVTVAAYTGSLEPVASTGPQCKDTFMVSQCPAGHDDIEIIHTSKVEAIRHTTAFVEADTSHLSAKTIQRLLEQVTEDAEDDDMGPMELEGGSAPAFLQSTRGVILSSGHQPPTGRTTSDVGSPEGPNTQLIGTLNSYAQEEPCLEAQPVNDTATESESEPEIVELRPRDSISQ
ncbi:hypothetical protein FRC08_000380 [Ceratobasidium sp. 394]|nr:hypothetical protein FRC08_000380 [Ceratobasidium sp. 394]KAG9098936.1 hypothetical protein FS749_002519 [Ceratobasidium sp. UAMH 11750]